MRAASDYDAIADLYDTYVQADFDLAYFQREVRNAAGPVLELMAGTGRVSLKIADLDARLTCVDASRIMLERLTTKLSQAGQRAQVVCADVRALPFDAAYELALIPFNSFMELTDPADQITALVEIRRCLRPGGRFICTLHNPTVRLQRLAEQERQLGSWPRPGTSGRLELWISERLDPDGHTAEACQTYRIYDEQGRQTDERIFRIRFALIQKEEFEALVENARFEILTLLGDYDDSSFEPSTSPYMIWMLRKPESGD